MIEWHIPRLPIPSAERNVTAWASSNSASHQLQLVLRMRWALFYFHRMPLGRTIQFLTFRPYKFYLLRWCWLFCAISRTRRKLVFFERCAYFIYTTSNVFSRVFHFGTVQKSINNSEGDLHLVSIIPKLGFDQYRCIRSGIHPGTETLLRSFTMRGFFPLSAKQIVDERCLGWEGGCKYQKRSAYRVF